MDDTARCADRQCGAWQRGGARAIFTLRLRHQHDGCRTQGKGGTGDGVAKLAAADARTGAIGVCHEELSGWA